MGIQAGKVFVALAAGMISTAAFAESTPSNDNAANSNAATPANITIAPASTTAAAPGAGTSTTSLPTAKAEVAPRKIKGEFQSDNTLSAASVAANKYVPDSGNIVGVKYTIGEAQTLGIRQPFSYVFPQEGKSGKATTGDLYINYVNGKIAALPSDIGLSGFVRVYLPTGESQRFTTRRQGALMGYMSADKSFGKFDVGYGAVVAYFNQIQDYWTKMGKEKKKVGGVDTEVDKATFMPNADYEIEQGFTVGYNLSDSLSLSQYIATDNVWYRPTPGIGMKKEQTLCLETSMTYRAASFLTLTASILSNSNIWDNPGPVRPYSLEDRAYRLLLSASL